MKILLTIFIASVATAALADDPNRIGQCEFFANSLASCTGKLRCRPSTTENVASFDTLCPGANERAEGTWSLNQGIIPTQFSRVPSSSEMVAKCDFYRNSTFACISGGQYQGNYWEGGYTGSLNAAFNLGLDKWSFLQRTTTTTTTTTSTALPHIPSIVREPEAVDYITESRNQNELEDGLDITETQTKVNIRQSEEAARNEVQTSEVEPVVSEREGHSRTDAGGVDGDGYSIHYSIRPRRVIICEYFTNGKVGCRDCTEKLQRIANNRRDYNCTNPPNGPPLKTWEVDNGIVPLTPDLEAASGIVAATCIFERWSNVYECHGSSATCPDRTSIDANKCLSGKRWNGEYHGSFDFLLSS